MQVAAAALSDKNLRQSKIAATVGCSDLFGGYALIRCSTIIARRSEETTTSSLFLH